MVEKDTIIPLASLSYLLIIIITNFLQLLTDIVYASFVKVKLVLKNVHQCINHSLPAATWYRPRREMKNITLYFP